ncbi:electron transfer flavoprotein-ubiquinone oxidoreductase [Agrobacterium genomosp. 3 str. CIP 111-78]|uniref:Electron transfer flavoprotein-ubiquinone oxidoreductase n=2 Tax=Rhizobium/Agrobacterium group TaxID=227290 RepID=A0A285UUU4_9HYPH|nr:MULTISPECIES: electron transfer flavoprotein-ubiquinone oxidoreductase [Rhizobium/Agrobacterium group]MCA2371110.1 electron transfer flavoprotein-ubiquinone oxidoreductase [Agrobacterium tomkonis CIP 111-78]QCM03593.1 electron transfer flavoprotein-ubiquinone oxidoreductase [Agrobacterium tumefaciens]SOC45553.1 flavin-dependent dehydrogenase [Rhizobium subbaraonis]
MTDQAVRFPERESMEFDVVIVGAGPAGLSAAIRLKQINPELSVVVLEKGGEVGAHILSGAVVDPVGIDRLLPGWREEEGHPFKTEVKDDQFLFLGPAGSIRLPNFAMPPLMNNHGNYIVSLGNVCRWLAGHAEALGVEIYPGFAASEVLYNDEGAVIGVATGDMGIEKNGEPGPNYTRGMELLGKYVLIGEGVRGSLAKQLIAKFNLSKDSDVQKFGIGLKELWQVKPENHKPGLVQHSFGWPLGMKTGGGSFLYHLEDNLVAVGFVVHLDYKNPYLFPFEEFQRYKTHPAIAPTFEGGKRLSYGARAITEGGYQSVPKLTFPGGALIGCSAGLVNVPRIKGSHNAVLSGMLAADKIAEAIASGRANDEVIEIENEWRASDIGKDLKRVRNVKPLWSRFGTAIGVGLGALDMWINQIFGTSPITLKHGKTDAESLEPAAKHKKIDYPRPDGVLTFDRLSSVFLSGTNHEEDQPVHLHVRDMDLQKRSEHDVYAGPSTRYCPAGVYEWVEKDGQDVFVINAQNCVHCKTCDIKDPNQNINWVPPQGGEGPVYANM